MKIKNPVVTRSGILLFLLMLSAINFLGYGNYIITFTLVVTLVFGFEYIYSVISQKNFLLLLLANVFYVIFLLLGINRIDGTIVVTALLMPLSAYLTGALYVRLSENKAVAVVRGVCYIALSSVVFGYFTSLRKGEIEKNYSDLYQINQYRMSVSIWDDTSLGATSLAMYLLPAIMCVCYGLFCLKGIKRIIIIIGGTLGIIASFGIASRLNILLAAISLIVIFLLAMRKDSGFNRTKVIGFTGGAAFVTITAFVTNVFGFKDAVVSSVLMQRLSYYKGNALVSSGRLEMYSEMLNEMIHKPFGGVLQESGISTHNLFLQFAISGGWIACVFIVWFVIRMYNTIIKNIINYHNDKITYLAVPIALGFLGIIMVESPVMSNPLLYSIFIAYLAMFNEYYTQLKTKL